MNHFVCFKMIYKAKISFLLWSRTIAQNPQWWKQKEAGIKWKQRLEEKIWNDGSRLWQIAFNLKTIQEQSWYLLQSQAKVLWGALKALSGINFAPLGHWDRKGGGFQRSDPKPWYSSPVCLPLSTRMTIWNYSPFLVGKYTIQKTIFPLVTTHLFLPWCLCAPLHFTPPLINAIREVCADMKTHAETSKQEVCALRRALTTSKVRAVHAHASFVAHRFLI